MTGASWSRTRPSTWLSRWPRGMWTAPGSAPWSYSSGSRTSRTTVPVTLRRSSASAGSTSVIRALVWARRSRKLAMVKAYRWGRDSGQAAGARCRAEAGDEASGQGDEGGEEIGDGPDQDRVGEAVHPCGLAVDDDDPRADRLGPGHDVGRGE